MANKKILNDPGSTLPPVSEGTPETLNPAGDIVMTPESLGELFAAKKPETQAYISAQKQPEPAKPAPPVADKYAALRDRYRRSFNPELHETTASGEPVTTRNGNLKCRPGRPRLSAVQLKPPQEVVDEKQAALAVQNEAQIKMCSSILVSCFLTVGVSTFGEEWKPKPKEEAGYNEVEMLQEATEEYFRASGTINLPPWAGLLCAYGMYSLPRIHQPKTLSKLEKFKMWIAYKWQNFRNKKAGKPPINPPSMREEPIRKTRQQVEAETAA